MRYTELATKSYRAAKTKQESFLNLFSAPNGVSLKVPAASTIVSQGEGVKSLYQVVSGHVRLCIYTEDGHRRIVSFQGAGSVIGARQLWSDQWNHSVEAVTNCVLRAVPKALVQDRLDTDSDVREGAMITMQSQIEQCEAHLVMMSILPATERLNAFLERFARMRGTDGFVALPMCRRDLGDYLGLSMETVSRSFSALRDSKRIETVGAEKFRLLDMVPTAPGHNQCHAA